MSPLANYYGALVACIAGLLAVGVVPLEMISGGRAWVLFLSLIAVFFYALIVVRCPRCDKRLSARSSWVANGLPGRTCPGCGHDLSGRGRSN